MKWLNELKSIEPEMKKISVLSEAKIFDFNAARKQSSQKKEPQEWVMDSPVLGEVSLSYDPSDPGRVMVDGMSYSVEEVKTLHGIGHEDLKRAHEVKRCFGGSAIQA